MDITIGCSYGESGKIAFQNPIDDPPYDIGLYVQAIFKKILGDILVSNVVDTRIFAGNLQK